MRSRYGSPDQAEERFLSPLPLGRIDEARSRHPRPGPAVYHVRCPWWWRRRPGRRGMQGPVTFLLNRHQGRVPRGRRGCRRLEEEWAHQQVPQNLGEIDYRPCGMFIAKASTFFALRERCVFRSGKHGLRDARTRQESARERLAAIMPARGQRCAPRWLHSPG